MTHKLTVRFGGAADSEVHDYSSQVRVYNADGSPAILGGMQCDNGSASMGELTLLDVENAIPHGTVDGLQLAAHNQLTWSNDAPGYDAWLSIGRIVGKTAGRPYQRTASVAREWTVQWADANMEIDGLALTADQDRPAETDVDRILWALGAFCNGDPRLTTVFATHLVSTAGAVTMPAKTYEAGTELDEIFQDCASTAGKLYSVVIHNQSSASHKCFLYIDEEDHTTYACTLSISDQLAEVDGETVFEPHWRQGGAVEEEGADLQTGIVSRYGMDTTATVVVTDTDHADAYDYWVKPYFDDVSETATQATARATAILHSRWTEHLTHTPSILIPARLHDLITAGMSISIRAAASMGGQYLNTEQVRRIAAIEWGPAGEKDGEHYLWANLQLDRPRRVLGAGSGTKPGPKPPNPGTPAGTVGWEEWTWDAGEEVVAHPGTAGVGPAASPWGAGDVGSGAPGGGAESTSGYTQMHDGGSSPVAASAGSTYRFSGYFYAFNTDVRIEVRWLNAADTAFQTDLIVYNAAWPSAWTSWTNDITAPTGTTQLQLKATTGASGGVDASGWVDQVRIQEVVAAVPGDSPPPAADDDTGSIGTPGDGCYATCDHKHPVQTAANTPFTPDGSIASTNVQDAVVEVRDEVPALSNATPLVESGSGSAGTAGSVSRSDHVHPADGGGGGGGSSPSPVQEKASGQAQNVSSYSLVMDSTPSNSMLLAWACEDSTTTISSISQTGVTWTRLNRTVVNGFGHELWLGTGAASTATVSVTMSASQWSHCAIVELSGLTGTLDNTQSGSGRAVMLRSTATTTVWVAQARNSGGGGFASVITVGAPNLFPIMQDRNGAIWLILAPATERNVVVMPGADGTAQTAILWAVD